MSLRRRLLATAAGTLAAALLLAGCGDPDAGGSAPPPAFDPPLGFAAPTGTLFGGSGSRVFGRDADDLPAALVGTTIWATDGGRLVHADSTGAAIPGPAAPPDRFVAGRPVATADGAVLVGGASVVPGSGTTPPGLSVDLLAFDAGTGALRWNAATVLPWTERPPAVAMTVAGRRRRRRRPDREHRQPADRARRRPHHAARALERRRGRGRRRARRRSRRGHRARGGDRAGREPRLRRLAVVALDAVTGLRRPDVAGGLGGEVLRAPEITPAGPGLAVVSGRTAATTLAAPSASLRFVDARGAEVRTVDVGSSYTPPRCVWDEAATTVCGGDTRVFAVDATTAAPLWELPDAGANRVAPRLTTAWHGAVYGTTVNGPVVLDARTGADRDTRPGAAPVLVNAYLGLGAEASGVAGFGGGATITPAVR